MEFIAKHPSLGFLGRYWAEGDKTPDLTEQEANCPEIAAHFEPVVGRTIVKFSNNDAEMRFNDEPISMSEITQGNKRKLSR